ncbi:MAG: hypothetical protein GX339_08800 [Tissierellia bacterium]|nr:hypothetical protein [Tissierellia bacterium]
MILDYILILTDEWDLTDDSSPGPITPISRVREVLDYIVTLVPREKILLNYPIYARDWVVPYEEGQPIETISAQEAMNRARRNLVNIQYDQVSHSPFYSYTDMQDISHEVWFEDVRSAQAKFDLVKEYNLRGLSYWSLAYPFAQNWALLEDNFIIVKD